MPENEISRLLDVDPNDREAVQRKAVEYGISSGSSDHPDLATHDAMGLATDAELTAHTTDDPDPHPIYALDTDLDVHVAASDPHTGYQKESEKGSAGGYASLDGSGFVPDAQLASSITRDSELTTHSTNVNAHHAQSHGNADHDASYITASGVTFENLDANGDVGTGASQVAQGNHSHDGLTPAGGVPVGGIIMWSGLIADIPSDWALCDGTANSPGPDLREKFVVGASADDAGVAKTNLTGSLTQSGGAVSHHHADHTASGSAVSAHTLSTSVAIDGHTRTTDVALSAHANGAVSAHTLSQNVALSAHANAAVSAHAGAAVSAHSLSTNVAIANHATSGFRTSASATLAAVTEAAHTITQPAVAAHSVTQPSAHSVTQADAHLITQPAVSAHSVTQPDAHVITQPAFGAHSLTQPVVAAHTVTDPTVSAHDTLSAPQPYYAIAFIQRMA